MWDAFLDATVVLSFGRSGFARHALKFREEDFPPRLDGRRVLVTGASSGIGLATATELCERGADVFLLCRSTARGQKAAVAISRQVTGGRVSVEELDVSSLESVRALARRFRRKRIDVLVHNAGVLPDDFRQTPDGLELTVATNVAGPHVLTSLLLDRLAASADPRVVFVSSGGMYPTKLDLDRLFRPKQPFDGVAAYSQTKRAQVVLARLLAERHPDITFASMHPGWADTPAVRTSLPRFHSLTRGILRTPEQGADTVVWLAGSRAKPRSGGFYFDRVERSTYLVPGTRESDEEARRLLAALDSLIPSAEP